jgi:tetratricopeptide (TPR) repeat protein
MPGGSKELDDAFEMLRSDPQRSLEICQRYVAEHPDDANGYFSRSSAWKKLGENGKALADMDKALELSPSSGGYSTRGVFFHSLGDYRRAIDDLTRAREYDEEEWKGSLDPHFRADCYARLGRLDEALADCAYIEEDHWTPGLKGLPAGNKQEFIEEIKRRALQAQSRRR